MTAPLTFYQVPTITDLRDVLTASCAGYGMMLTNMGANALAHYTWNASDSRADDGADVIKPTDQTGNGRWNRAGSAFPGGGGVSAAGILAIGGAPGVLLENGYQAGMEAIATDTSGGKMMTYGYGSQSPNLHMGKARGTLASPLAPSTGDRILDIASRCYLPSAGDFNGSSFAMLAVLKATAASPYTPCSFTIEATGNHSPNREAWLAMDNGNMTLGGWGGFGSARLHIGCDGAQNALIISSNDYSTGMLIMGRGNQTPNGGENGADTMMWLRKDAYTGRSLNAAGTVNASGADYAEYERLADGVDKIVPGQLVGFDADGRVTDKWTDSVSFAVKSTNPSYVGGDDWASDAVLGVAKPDALPALVPPAAPEFPGVLREDATDTQKANHERRLDAYRQDMATFQEKLDIYDAAMAARPAVEAQFASQMAQWQKAHDQARARVDRIAYCGKVPVNVTGAKPGQYIVPVANKSGGIVGLPVGRADLADHEPPVGRVRRILPDGRAEISVSAP